ncbi:hypothetical protein [Rhodoferax lacus]|uniref:Agd3-related carbohydrate deacetylase n=1 Tax=Rhodoferax lacus TaxID=2184758 RepID=UPI0018F7C0BC|nr:hypothetical protein [Rhodoferax lacus]
MTYPTTGWFDAKRPIELPRNRLRWCSQFTHWLMALVVVFACQPWLARAETPVSIDMKLLVVSADGTEPVYAAIQATLNQLGIPYDTLIASQTPLAAQQLSDGLGNGHYQGILLTTGNLAYQVTPGVWDSAFTAAEWSQLWQYEADFRIRQVTLYTYPAGAPDNYGLNVVTAQGTDTQPLTTQLTSAGKQVFGYLNTKNPILIRNAWTYLATPIAASNPVPLLTTSTGYAIASIYTYPNGRQNLTLTTDGNPDLTHTLLLGYGVVNWVSKGIFLGQRGVYLNAQPDDVMIPDDLWDVRSLTDTTGLEYRISGTDYKQLIAWQSALQASNPMYAQIRLEMPFNGVGVSGIYPKDTLTSAIKNNPNAFKWISHTYDHELLTAITYSAATTELKNNQQVAQKIGFNRYFRDSMIQPEISGLANPEFLRAAYDFGIRYILSDTSQPGWANPSPNTGFYSSFQPGILIIPRYPTNLYYNVSTPAEWVSEYNHFYGPGGLFPTWDHALTYPEVLDKESEVWLRYFLKYSINSVMFHQSNLRAYDGTHSLLGDLVNAALTKYGSMMALPVRSPSQHDTGVLMAARMAYNASGVSARLQLGTNNTIVLKAATAVQVPLTGVSYGSNTQLYGGQTISTVPLTANTPLTIPAPAW